MATTSQKSCLRCAAAIPLDSQHELCVACSTNVKAETPPQSDPPQVVGAFAETLTVNKQRSADLAPDHPTWTVAAGQSVQHRTGLNNPDFALDSQITFVDQGAIQTPSDIELLPHVPNYQILREIGAGGGGVVYHAIQELASRPVAVKILISTSKDSRERFLRETRALGRIRHPNVIEIYEVGECAAGPFYSMELLPGGSLAKQLKEHGKLADADTAALLETIARGMHHVHQQGLIHRDLKPGNILLDERGQPKIADFGLAKNWLVDADAVTVEQLTKSNALLGTPSYMAPEQADGDNRRLDHRCDVYGLGAIMYQCLTGKPPFSGKSAAIIIDRVVKQQPKYPSSVNPSVDQRLEAICMKCMAKKPEDRYQSAEAFADELAAWQRGGPLNTKPISRWQHISRTIHEHQQILAAATALSLLMLLMLSVGYWLNRHPTPEVVTLDPDRELKAIRQEIATGKPVTLIDSTGNPRWYDATQLVNFGKSSYLDQPCHLESTKQLFVPLLRAEDVPTSYLLEADVRHESAAKGYSLAGLQFGTQTHITPDGLERVFANRLAMNDITAKSKPTFPNSIRYQIGFDVSIPGEGILNRDIPLAGLEMKPTAFTEPNLWRHMSVLVTPSTVSVSGNRSDHVPFKEFTLAEIVNQYQLNHRTFLPNETIPADVTTTPFRGALGIYVRAGSASFKNVTIRKQ